MSAAAGGPGGSGIDYLGYVNLGSSVTSQPHLMRTRFMDAPAI